MQWFQDVENHFCQGGHCDDCNCFVLSMRDHYCPMKKNDEQDEKNENKEKTDGMVVIKCFECDVMMDQQHMHRWKQKNLCSSCYRCCLKKFERQHTMTLLRSGFYFRLPECPSCNCILKYCWDLEHQVKKLIDQGEEDLAKEVIEDQFGTFKCISCLTEKLQYVMGDETPWECDGACKKQYVANIFMDDDSVKKEFAGKVFCISCYSNDREIKIAKSLIEEVVEKGLDAKCSGCFETIVKHDLDRVIQCDRLFGLSIRDYIDRGDVLQIVHNMFGMKELCERCWVNIQNVGDALGISADRKRIEMARTRRILHPKCHPDVETIIFTYEMELRKTKRYQMFEKIFKTSSLRNGKGE